MICADEYILFLTEQAGQNSRLRAETKLLCHDLSSHNISTAVLGRNISLALPFSATTMTVDTVDTDTKLSLVLVPSSQGSRNSGRWKKHSHCHNRRALSGRDLKALSVNNRLISSMIPQLQASLRELSPFDWLSRRSWATSSSQGGGRETQLPLTSASVNRELAV